MCLNRSVSDTLPTEPETLRIVRPCTRRWDDLTGDETRRFCTDCSTLVHNLDRMSRPEIDALLRAGRFCAAYLPQDDGSFVMPPPPDGGRWPPPDEPPRPTHRAPWVGRVEAPYAPAMPPSRPPGR